MQSDLRANTTQLGTIDAETGAALVGAGILSVLVFPRGALILLRKPPRADAATRAAAPG